MLTVPATSCATRYLTVSEPAEPCDVPAWPVKPEVVYTDDCVDGAVCLTVDSAVDLGSYLREVEDVEEALDGCPSLDRPPPPADEKT